MMPTRQIDLFGILEEPRPKPDPAEECPFDTEPKPWDEDSWYPFNGIMDLSEDEPDGEDTEEGFSENQ
jgi:hypothetical protein